MSHPEKPPVVLLAAGANSRFFPLNTKVHKSGISLLGHTIIERLVADLSAHGYKKIITVASPRDRVGSFAELVTQACMAHQVNLAWVEQSEPLGSGDAIMLASEYVDQQFAVINPTMLNAGEYLDLLLAKSQETNSPDVLLACETNEPWLYGILTMDKDKAIGIVEKPDPGTEASKTKVEGVYLLSQRYLKELKAAPKSEYNLEFALNKLMSEHGLPVVHINQHIPSLKYSWHIFDFLKFLLKDVKSYRSPSAHISTTAVLDESEGPIYIADGATIGHATRIVGPCYIGRGAYVGDFSLVRASSLEAGAVAGAFSELVRSVLMEQSTFHQGYIADSIIGPDVKIGAGFISANKRLDRAHVNTYIKGHRVDTRLSSFGTIIGQGASLGIACRTTPGVLIGAETVIHPSVTLMKNIDHHRVVTNDERLV